MAIKVTETEFPGLLIIEPQVFGDNRGYFCETFSERDFKAQTGLDIRFVQDNESRSCRGVLRGLHFQKGEAAQTKLVRCSEGAIVDFVLDIRKGSPTFGRWFAAELSADNHRQLFIPKGFAHGFAVLSPFATFQYKCDALYSAESEAGISILSPELGIDIPFAPEEVIMSQKDTLWPDWQELKNEEFFCYKA